MSDERKKVTLTKPWGRYPAGRELGVLERHENPAPGLVDAARAATLVEHGFATRPGDRETAALPPFDVSPVESTEIPVFELEKPSTTDAMKFRARLQAPSTTLTSEKEE